MPAGHACADIGETGEIGDIVGDNASILFQTVVVVDVVPLVGGIALVVNFVSTGVYFVATSIRFSISCPLHMVVSHATLNCGANQTERRRQEAPDQLQIPVRTTEK